jgi:anti-sigma factor RsiW
MSTDPLKTESSLEEQLVAYLDGEMDAESSRRIEERLVAEPEVREALNRLERTWEMLDELGSTPVGDSFTRTTLEMVTVAAEEDVQRELAAAPLRRRRRFWLMSAGVVATAVAGFAAACLSVPNPNHQLLQDLPVLENLEEYRQIEDIKFLRMMKDAGLFAKEENDGQ